MSFDAALRLVLANEGGYANHPADRGGPTNFGVTQTTYDVYRASIGESRREVRDITQAEVGDIYRRSYWERAHCDDLPSPLDAVHFDAAVNHGPRVAVKLLQRALGLADDGIFGPVTQAAAQHATSPSVLSRYLAARLRLYADIVARDASQQVFLRGWLKRLDDVEKAAA